MGKGQKTINKNFCWHLLEGRRQNQINFEHFVHFLNLVRIWSVFGSIGPDLVPFWFDLLSVSWVKANVHSSERGAGARKCALF